MSNKYCPLASISVLDRKSPMISSRYRGIGRPRKEDYDYKSINELQDEMNELINKKLDFSYLTNLR